MTVFSGIPSQLKDKGQENNLAKWQKDGLFLEMAVPESAS